MSQNTIVFVEGDSDKHFIRCLLEDMGRADVVQLEVLDGGPSKLKKMRTTIQRHHDEGKRIAVIVDANRRVNERRKELRKAIASLNAPVQSTFLIPNDRDEGNLEVLLEQITVEKHQVIFKCFEKFKKCLEQHRGGYTMQNDKGKIYAYCEAVGSPVKDTERDYGDGRYWNLRANELKPLRDFLERITM